jgi:hypothetical protein
MLTTGFPKPVNDTQRIFKGLCEKGGGQKGGPARIKVQQLLKESGQALNELAYKEVAEHIKELPSTSPWHICFAIGLSWGHLAQFDVEFTRVATRLIENWNDDDLKIARQFHYERGPDPIEDSLRGGHVLFSKVKLPEALPDGFTRLRASEDRWLSPILSKERPRYIGSWNATAMFMVALFAQPSLAATLVEPRVMLPPGGPIYNALALLHRVHFLAKKPDGSELDDEAFEPGAIYTNNALFVDILKGLSGWSLVDVHSGLYMLGTRDPRSENLI